MTKQKTTKRALLFSALSLLMCVSMLIGSTFAWFTDSVTSTGNKIVAGSLNIDMSVMDENGTYQSVKENSDAIFGYTLWEPGYTEWKNIKVSTTGNLALKYAMNIAIKGERSILADVIDVYYVASEIKKTDDRSLDNFKHLGTISEILDSISGALINDTLIPDQNNTEDYATIVLKMQESAGNDYQGKTIGEFDIQLFATQLTYEKDSFDEFYDKSSAVFTVPEANALMVEGFDATLANCVDTKGILEVPANYTGTLTIINSTIKSVQGAGDVNLVILGNVVVNAKGSGTTTLASTTVDGSAITANGKLNISGKGNLTAIAADVNGAFGIGGMNTTSISIKDITIDYASGSYVYGIGSDTKYYKDAPEGGAAIGSNHNGATITLDNVTVTKAIGGSKAAGIGARYHVGVTINITDSTIAYVEGGVTAAGIGSSRVSGDATENGTTITITNSTITAKGGVYGAGIGSGYDTHCASKQPLCTINITDSTINATGGQYAAGVGSGYHNAALAGEIKNSIVTAVSGEKIYKKTYTPAMDIGFGVVDPDREGKQTDSYITYNGTRITLANAPAIAMNNEELDDALNAGETEILLNNGIFIIPDSAKNKTLTIIGSGETIIATQDDGSYEGCDYSIEGSTVAFKNITINTDSTTYTGYARLNATYENCTINGTYTLYGDSTFTNCTFSVSGDVYNIWTWGAPNATFTGCTFNSDGKALLLYGTENTNLTLNNCTFNDNGGLTDLKAAVEIGNDYGKAYTLTVNNTVVNGYEINDKGINTGTTLWANKNSMGTDKLNVVVDGVDVY